MAIDVETKDCTSVTDAELGEMEELVSESPHPFSMGMLSKQAEEWVLVTTARDNGKLKGFVFTTLERIGGTPAVLMGIGAVTRTSRRNTVLRGIMAEMFHRALMAFPDEDVVIGTRFDDASGFDLFANLDEVVPRPGHKASGEERAWGRRFAKRFGISATAYDDRCFTVRGDGSLTCLFSHESAKPEKIDADVRGLLGSIDPANGDSMIAFAWAMADKLEKLGS
jgi:hypothetical protein